MQLRFFYLAARCEAKKIMAVDFFHVDTVLLRRLCMLFFIEHGACTWPGSRLIQGEWVTRQAGTC